MAQIAKLNYVQRLRETFSKRQILRPLEECSLVWPDVNRVQYFTAPAKTLEREIPRRLGRVDLRFKWRRLATAKGLMLWGFYLPPPRATIFINTALSPIEATAAWSHEVGHHLARRALGQYAGVRYYIGGRLYHHLDDPAEFAADLVVSFVGFPRKVANELLDQREKDWRALLPPDSEILRKLGRHVEGIYDPRGIGPKSSRPARNMNYFAAVAHYGKLRWAALRAFDI
ncbi:MAG: hypothetical protein ACLQAT_13855 [Candidatus Binataceae bacterium]